PNATSSRSARRAGPVRCRTAPRPQPPMRRSRSASPGRTRPAPPTRLRPRRSRAPRCRPRSTRVGQVEPGADGHLQNLAGGLGADPLPAVAEQVPVVEAHLAVVGAGVLLRLEGQPP